MLNPQGYQIRINFQGLKTAMSDEFSRDAMYIKGIDYWDSSNTNWGRATLNVTFSRDCNILQIYKRLLQLIKSGKKGKFTLEDLNSSLGEASAADRAAFLKSKGLKASMGWKSKAKFMKYAEEQGVLDEWNAMIETGAPEVNTVSEGLQQAEKKLDENPKAFVYYEPQCQIPESFEALKELGLPVIEDISQSLGSVYSDTVKAGMGGDIVLSEFEENAVVSTGGGAAAVSSDDTKIENLKKEASIGSPYVDLPDMNAALGIVQLSKVDALLARRNELYRLFVQSQMKSGAKLFGSSSPSFFANGFGFSVIVNTKPDDAIEFARKHEVSAKRTFSQSIGSRYQDKYDRFPNAIAPVTRAISFPLYPFLSKAEIESIRRVVSHLG